MREAGTRSTWRRLPGWLKRLSEIGASPSDSEELRVRKAVLVLSSTLMASLAFVWVATYAALGLWVSAAIPFAYQVATAASIYTFARTRRYRLFRRSQLWMSLLLPFALQWSLGGFGTSSAVDDAIGDRGTQLDYRTPCTTMRRSSTWPRPMRSGGGAATSRPKGSSGWNAQHLLRVASDDAATPHERQSAYAKARHELDGLMVLPAITRAGIERRIAGEIEA